MIVTGGRNEITPLKLRVIRFAMLAMLLMLGGFMYVAGTHRPPDAQMASSLDAIRLAGYALCAGAIVGLAVLRQVRARAADPLARMRFALVGSALAEGSALLGAVFMLMGGEPWIYLLGLLVFLGSWGLLPADPAQDA
jgi:hypothetical protein